jgi:hypothetical protein
MNDDLSLHPAPTLTDQILLALLLASAADDVLHDPGVSPFRRLDALGNKISNVKEMASALRLFAADLARETHPDAVSARAAANEATKVARQHAFDSSPIKAAVLKRQEMRAATEALEEATKDLATAEEVLAREQRAGTGPATAAEHVKRQRDVVLARGAVAEAKARKLDAEAKIKQLRATPAAE